MDKFNLINYFLTATRLGSFAATAAHLGVNPSTVSKSVDQLEKHLDFRLFHRTTRKLQLTDEGKLYRDKCTVILGDLEYCEQQLHSETNSPKGLLKINLPVAYGQLYIMPMLAAFCERYPDITIDVSLTDEYVDMISHSIDIAIRSGSLQDSRMVARKLSPMDFAMCASPSFIASRKKITWANLEKQPWIVYRFSQSGKLMPIFGTKNKNKKKTYFEFSPKPTLITTDGLSMVTACKAGLGLMLAPHFLVRDALEKGELEIIQPYYRSTDFNVYAYYSHKGYVPTKVKVFIDFVVEQLSIIGENPKSTYLSQY